MLMHSNGTGKSSQLPSFANGRRSLRFTLAFRIVLPEKDALAALQPILDPVPRRPDLIHALSPPPLLVGHRARGHENYDTTRVECDKQWLSSHSTLGVS